MSGLDLWECSALYYPIGGKVVGMAKSVDRKVEGKTVHVDGLCLSH